MAIIAQNFTTKTIAQWHWIEIKVPSFFQIKREVYKIQIQLNLYP
jgi:hypothetical protein